MTIEMRRKAAANHWIRHQKPVGQVWVIVRYTADRISSIGPAFNDRQTAEHYALSIPEEHHAFAERVEMA